MSKISEFVHIINFLKDSFIEKGLNSLYNTMEEENFNIIRSKQTENFINIINIFIGKIYVLLIIISMYLNKSRIPVYILSLFILAHMIISIKFYKTNFKNYKSRSKLRSGIFILFFFGCIFYIAFLFMERNSTLDENAVQSIFTTKSGDDMIFSKLAFLLIFFTYYSFVFLKILNKYLLTAGCLINSGVLIFFHFYSDHNMIIEIFANFLNALMVYFSSDLIENLIRLNYYHQASTWRLIVYFNEKFQALGIKNFIFKNDMFYLIPKPNNVSNYFFNYPNYSSNFKTNLNHGTTGCNNIEVNKFNNNNIENFKNINDISQIGKLFNNEKAKLENYSSDLKFLFQNTIEVKVNTNSDLDLLDTYRVDENNYNNQNFKYPSKDQKKTLYYFVERLKLNENIIINHKCDEANENKVSSTNNNPYSIKHKKYAYNIGNDNVLDQTIIAKENSSFANLNELMDFEEIKKSQIYSGKINLNNKNNLNLLSSNNLVNYNPNYSARVKKTLNRNCIGNINNPSHNNYIIRHSHVNDLANQNLNSNNNVHSHDFYVNINKDINFIKNNKINNNIYNNNVDYNNANNDNFNNNYYKSLGIFSFPNDVKINLNNVNNLNFLHFHNINIPYAYRDGNYRGNKIISMEDNRFRSNYSHDSNIYLDVHYKKEIFDGDVYLELLIRDYTESFLANSKIESEQENQKKLAKLLHEFKTPLNSIIGLISQISVSGSILSKIDNLSIINNLSNYLIFLVNDIIQFTSHSQNRENIQIFIEQVNLKTILEFCFNILKALIICKEAEKSIKTILDMADKIENISVRSDDMRIKQIILNFISNAVKFTKSGSITLKAKIKKTKKNIKVSIIDTGIGIREEDKIKIFQDSVEKNSSKNNRLGSGLGLAISKLISEKLNLRIKFNSVYGEGSNFSISIPYEKIIQQSDKSISNFVPPSIQITSITTLREKQGSKEENEKYRKKTTKSLSACKNLHLSTVQAGNKKATDHNLENGMMNMNMNLNINETILNEKETIIIHDNSQLLKYCYNTSINEFARKESVVTHKFHNKTNSICESVIENTSKSDFYY